MLEPVRLLPEHKDRVVEALARAFEDDSLYAYICPDAARRGKAMRALLDAVVRFTLVYGEAWTTPEAAGAACWLPPGRTSVTLWQIVQTGFALPLAGLRFGLGSVGRATDAFGYANQVHARAVPGPHWYLWVLGVEPVEQGRGVGTSLLEPVLARADIDGLPCYLETETERNVTFYEKRGFDVIESKRVARGREMLWMMVRKPG